MVNRSKKKVKKETKKQSNKRKLSLIYTLIALGFIVLMFILNYDLDFLLILPAIFFLYLGRKYLLE
tara:strand:- start:10 stop:207 length:198 start_codon:yes stop_codon:yes gene_type:complete